MSKTNPKVVKNEAAQSANDDQKGAPNSLTREFKAVAEELVKAQRRMIEKAAKILVIVEGRDASGKDGAIRKITKHMSPRETHVQALGKPTDRDQRAWYFERWVGVLPVAGEITFLNRSWYNRAGVERVMGFCSEEDVQRFLETAPMFEHLLIHCGFKLIKYYLDVSRGEQKSRLKSRRDDPLKRWKRSPVDDKAIELWDEYSKARDEMLLRTSSAEAPWLIVKADDKNAARLAMMRDFVSRLRPSLRSANPIDPSILREFVPDMIENGFLA